MKQFREMQRLFKTLQKTGGRFGRLSGDRGLSRLFG